MSPFGSSTPVEEVVKTFASCIKGRVFLITGTSANGLGANAVISLARGAPSHLILVSRSKAKTEPVLAEIVSINATIKTTFVTCELSDQDSVRKAAEEINSNPTIDHIDIVINNAGVMNLHEYTADKHGLEMQLSSNYVGHFLLTNLIMPKILASDPGARIINMTSHGHQICPFRFDDYNFNNGTTYDGWSAYGQSKTANILFTVELARRLGGRGVRSYSVHPGGILVTGLASHLTMDDFAAVDEVARRNTGKGFVVDEPRPLSQGTSSMICAALDPALDAFSGAYIEDCQLGKPYSYAVDEGYGKMLWKLSEELVGQMFDV